MSDYQHNHKDYGCPHPNGPANQPPVPGDDCKEPPLKNFPPECKPTCPEKERHCTCPTPPTQTEHCLEDLIEAQTKKLTVADKAKAFKGELESLLTKAKAASLEYNVDTYKKLVDLWIRQDSDIVDLIRKLECAVPCWRCVIECYVCPLLDELHLAERWLYGDDKTHCELNDLYELRFWHERNRDAAERVFERVKAVLTAWEKPAQTIAKNLETNAKLIIDCRTALGADSAKAVYDVFLKLIPMHLAIAPPVAAPENWVTKIGNCYTQFCGCDIGEPEACCGPDVGKLSMRQRLIGSQPYLVKPNDYFKVICCLADKRYRPANERLAAATAEFEKYNNAIKSTRAQIDNGLKDFEKKAKAGIPSAIECNGWNLAQPQTESSKTS